MIDLSRFARPRPPLIPDQEQLQPGWLELGRGPAGIAAIPPPSLARTGNMTLAAQAGGGKTTLLGEAVVDALCWSFAHDRPGQRRAFLVGDPKADLLDQITGSVARHPHLIPSLRYVNVFARRGGRGGISLNLVKTIGNDQPELVSRGVAHMLARTAVGGGVLEVAPGHRMLQVMFALIAGCYDADHPRSSLLWAVDALELRDGPERLARLCRTERVRSQVMTVATAGSEAKLGALARLRGSLTGWDEIERQIGAPQGLPVEELCASGCTLIDLSDVPAGGSEFVNVYGNLLFSELMRHLLARPTGFRGHHVTILIDEVFQFLDVMGTYGRKMYELGRSKAISMWIAGQQLRGLRDTGALYHAIVANCTNFVYGRQGYEDAATAAREAFGSQSSSEATRFVEHLVRMPPQHFYLVQPGRRLAFEARRADFAAMQRALRDREGELLAAMNRLSVPLPPPVRLGEVGGPRSQQPTPATRRSRSFLG